MYPCPLRCWRPGRTSWRQWRVGASSSWTPGTSSASLVWCATSCCGWRTSSVSSRPRRSPGNGLHGVAIQLEPDQYQKRAASVANTVLMCSLACFKGCVLSGAADEQPPGHQGRDRRPQRQLHRLHRAGQSSAGQKTLRFRRGPRSASANNTILFIIIMKISTLEKVTNGCIVLVLM